MSILPPAPLPTASLESLKFKATQLHESIIALQRLIEYGNVNAMPSWPDILSKYSVLLSQSLNLSISLVGVNASEASGEIGGGSANNQFSRIALHPSQGLTDQTLDNDLIPLLRNQQTTDVLRRENDTVRRLGEKMLTKGVAGVLGLSGDDNVKEKPTYSEVISELTSIRNAHDARADRAIRAVTMLREKYEWKTRVEVEVEEPEELEWDPRRTGSAPADNEDEEINGTEGGDQSSGSDDEGAVGAMVGGDGDGGGPVESPVSGTMSTPSAS